LSMEDPRLVFLETVQLDTTKVVQFPGLILLCGGQIGDASIEPISVRDYVLRQLNFAYSSTTSGRIVLPEDLFDWATDSVYADIFELEQHLAALASTVVLFVESPGSIAELGAFCLLRGVGEKLLVFVHKSHHSQSSFIRQGPIRYLEQEHAGSVLFYDWRLPADDPNRKILSDNDLRAICKIIVQSAGTGRTNRPFDGTRHSDVMLLISALLNQMIGLQLHEIQNFLTALGSPITIALLRKYLFVLRHQKIVELIPHGRLRIYVPTGPMQPLRFGFKSGKPSTDRYRLLIQIADYYRLEDPGRHEAVAPYLARLS
jgi:hypothetical protein